MEALREEKQLRFCPWMHTQQEGREFAGRGCSAIRGERQKNLRETKNAPQKPVREEKTKPKSW